MISNSWVWKRELEKELAFFDEFIYKADFSPKSVSDDDDYVHLQLEKFFFVVAFLIRKLHESNKLSDELIARTIPMIEHRRINNREKLAFFNRADLNRYYDLENGTQSSLSVISLCNILIHSFEFMPVFEEDYEQGQTEFAGVVVNSDRSKDTAIYYLMLEDFTNLIKEVINDNIRSTSYNYESGKYKKSRNNHNA